MEETGFGYSRGVWTDVRPRLGERNTVGTSIVWRPVEPVSRRRRGRRTPPVTHPAVLHDVSVSGARLLVPVDDHLEPRAKVEIELDGAWTTARIAWVQPSYHPEALWCGVMFLEAGPAFLDAIARTVSARTP